MMIFSVIAKKPISLEKIENIPFLLKILGELIKDGWSKAAWYDCPYIFNTLQIFKDQYPQCKTVIIEPPVFVSFQIGIDVVKFFNKEGIELIGIVNETF
ncbi:MAG TPA: hypothetical protein LFV66_02150 [Rickettsia endosymbiont of Bembidion lapponicum]|nr:hypothetical protein [Rickettsia endosymbiont of Bembidion lapponicum]